MIDYRVAKKQGGFNLQKLYTDILKSKSTDRWYVQGHGDKVLISNCKALYLVPGRFPLESDFIEKTYLKDLVPDWGKGVPCVYSNLEVPLTDKISAKVFRKDDEDFYFNRDFFKYFTGDDFDYRLSKDGRALYVAYKGDLIAMILRIKVSK